tara:strand:+ start:1153 stop:1974 length:822 start_codon:yes stop_codon:yes gene_type:complete
MNITFATCWYNLKSKFEVEIYRKWMSYFINNVNNFNLVIYTNKESYSVLEPLLEYNKNEKIKVIFKEWNEFHGYQWRDNWINNHENNNLLNDKSRFNTDWKLNMLWSEKINFVKEIMDKKYFDTEWYGWCDIGYFRGGNNSTNEEIKKWPNKDKINSLDKNKIYYGLPGNKKYLNLLTRNILTKNKNNMPEFPIPPHQVSVAGGFFLTHKDKLEWWHTIYYKRLNDYFTHKYLVKDDQVVIIDSIINNLKNFKLIEEQDPIKDRWFVFQSFLL